MYFLVCCDLATGVKKMPPQRGPIGICFSCSYTNRVFGVPFFDPKPFCWFVVVSGGFRVSFDQNVRPGEEWPSSFVGLWGLEFCIEHQRAPKEHQKGQI